MSETKEAGREVPGTEADFMAMIAGEDGRPHPFLAIAVYASMIGKQRLNEMAVPGQAVRLDIDSRWVAWVNPHNAKVVTPEGDPCPSLNPFWAYVEYNGWPAGLGSPLGMEFIDHEDGGACNMESFARDVYRAALSRTEP